MPLTHTQRLLFSGDDMVSPLECEETYFNNLEDAVHCLTTIEKLHREAETARIKAEEAKERLERHIPASKMTEQQLVLRERLLFTLVHPLVVYFRYEASEHTDRVYLDYDIGVAKWHKVTITQWVNLCKKEGLNFHNLLQDLLDECLPGYACMVTLWGAGDGETSVTISKKPVAK